MAGGGGKESNYWPGFVDALTNVVIAMVFVIVVLAISLSFSAQLLAKRMAAKVAQLENEGAARAAVSAPAPAPEAAPPAPRKEDAGSDKSDAGANTRTVIDVRGNEAAAKAGGGTLRAADNFLMLQFAPAALTLDTEAADKLVAALGPVKERLGASGRVKLIARGPAMDLTDNQRAAYLRVMAVRNILIDQGIPADRIEPRIDTETNAARASVSIAVEGKP